MDDGKKESAKKGEPADKAGPGPPTISLPKGGGAIRGIGEKFAANPVTGTGSMSVPIAVSPGRSGFGPQLSLSYDSGAGNGPFGFGWSLSVPCITRKTDKGLPKYQDSVESDVFILSGAEDLVPVLTQSASGQWMPEVIPPRTVNGLSYRIQRYRPRIEGLFARIERWTNQADPSDTFWRSISKDNITTWYGKTAESRIADPVDSTRIFSWLICESYDDKGNVIVYGYKPENSDGIDLSQVHERNRSVDTRTANRYLKRIRYSNHAPYLPTLSETDPWPVPPGAFALAGSPDWFFEAVFDYGDHDEEAPLPQESESAWPVRNDPFSSYRAGFEVRTYRLCQRVLMFHHFPGEESVGENCLVRSTDFAYSYEDTPSDARNPIYSFLLKATQSGYRRTPASKKSLPPLEFEYTKPTIDETVQVVDADSLDNLPYGLDGARYQWVDLDGEGISGILTEQGNGWFYKRNLSPISVKGDNGQQTTVAKFAPVEVVASKPSLAQLSAGSQQFLDLAGDGKLDLVQFNGTPGFYERTESDGWENFTAFQSLPTVNWQDPNLKFVDLTGDGHADVLLTENEAFTWHHSLAEDGFGPAERVHQALDEETGPRLIFADGTQSIYLADMSGDGLTDLVRIRNGEVCYWPNLGYGLFGTKVTMDNAPWFDYPDQFNQQRVRLADIDGSGTNDIIYLGRDGVHLYFNQSGNGWGPSQTLAQFPQIDNLTSVTTLDLLGNGTACLVWSSSLPGDAGRQMRYIDLMGGQRDPMGGQKRQKPHLLVKMVNNLGAETVAQYAPSTKFYLQDKRDGRPWITRLPFPVHVVERVETYDHISRNRFVTRYAYHHGYFDGPEREFRGFGMVEQFDTEEFAALTSGGDLTPADNIDAASHVPPVLTRTWFHTGAYLGRDHVSDFFAGLLNDDDAGEYYREPGFTDAQATQLLLNDTELPAGLNLEEEREACRALKGAMLRQEVYALDGTEKEKHPYTVSEQNFTIQGLQPRGDNRHGVFFTHPRQAINYHYERNPTDPRVSHSLTLEVDKFGNVLKSVSIGYGRRLGQSPPPDDDRKKQEQILITYTENDVTNPVDDAENYRTPLPSATRTYELTRFEPAGNAEHFSFDEWANDDFALLKEAVEIQYEETADPTPKQRRLIEHVRTLYKKNDLSGFLPLGELESLSIPFESYKLAFTPGLLDQVYVRNLQRLLPANPADVLEGGGADRGGYIDLDNNAHWWIPSGKIFFSPSSEDTPAEELTYARQHFFLPHRHRDPFHTDAVSTESFVSYDAYDLLMVETRDALGNRITVGERDTAGNLTNPGNDYRVLQPRLVMDPNRNRAAVAFDALGMVVGTAVMGKPLPAPVEGDSLDGFAPDLTQTQLDGFYDVTDPHVPAPNLLKGATTRIVYDLERFRRTQQAYPKEPTQWLPVYAATLARETHASDPLPSHGFKIQISFSYSDGFGREIQKKIQAEAGPLVPGGPVVSPRWVGSGWTIFNNKGKPVRQYEPFFSQLPERRHRFEFGVQAGVSPVLFYDPVERVVATLHPNHTYDKVVFDPWQQTTFDVNDTVAANGAETGDPRTDKDIQGYTAEYFKAQSNWQTWYQERITGTKGPQEKSSAEKAAKHANTPSVAHLDSLGRPFLTFAHNGFKPDSTSIQFPTRAYLDIEGNQREVRDAIEQNGDSQGRTVMYYDYDMLGTKIHQASMEAGDRWMLNDVAGKPIRAWDSRGFMRRITYDELRRPTGMFVMENGSERLGERTIYGEGQGAANNHLTRVFQVSDGAGVVTNVVYDFKGNMREGRRDLLPDYKQVVDWLQNLVANDGSFTSTTTFDALNRPSAVTAPDKSVYRPTYNEANLLDKVDVHLRGVTVATPFVTNIDYNAKGQRTLINYHNGAQTTYEYDDQTFRLIHLKTTRTPGQNGLASQIFKSAATVQDLHYTYDPVGNITRIEDVALKIVFHSSQQVEPVGHYTYDALYRLIEAQGREHIGQTALDFNPPNGNHRDHPFVGLGADLSDLQALRNYTQRYEYDAVGNFEALRHLANGGSWTRRYDYEETSHIEADKQSNQLTRTTLGNGSDHTETYTHDAHGNMTRMPHLPLMQWDDKDQLHATSKQVVNNGGPRETTYYVYDAGGQRVRKVTETENGTRKDERIYLGGFEVYRTYNGNGQTITLERETLHVMDDKRRIALVETRTRGSDGTPGQLLRYQFDNHLGSASLELDQVGQIISYEEYYPYGSTSYQAGRSVAEVSLKRYRYTGKERDEETGLSYHGARYYAAWLGRWAATDPEGISDGVNLYGYVSCNPIVLMDPSGQQGESYLDKLTQGARQLAVGTLKAGTEITKDVIASTGITAPVDIALKLSTSEGRKELLQAAPMALMGPIGAAINAGVVKTIEHKKSGESTTRAVAEGLQAAGEKVPFGRAGTELLEIEKAATKGDVSGTVQHGMLLQYHFAKDWASTVMAFAGATKAPPAGAGPGPTPPPKGPVPPTPPGPPGGGGPPTPPGGGKPPSWIDRASSGQLKQYRAKDIKKKTQYDRLEIETKSGKNVKSPDAVKEWNNFLGKDQVPLDPLGVNRSTDRIWSATGEKSIRYGTHEMNSPKPHYHQENWFPFHVENLLQRVQKK